VPPTQATASSSLLRISEPAASHYLYRKYTDGEPERSFRHLHLYQARTLRHQSINDSTISCITDRTACETPRRSLPRSAFNLIHLTPHRPLATRALLRCAALPRKHHPKVSHHCRNNWVVGKGQPPLGGYQTITIHANESLKLLSESEPWLVARAPNPRVRVSTVTAWLSHLELHGG